MKIQAVIFDLGGTLIDYTNEYESWPDLETPGLTAAYSHLSQKRLNLPGLNTFKQAGFARLPARWESATRGEQNLRLVDFLAETLADVGVTAVPDTMLVEAATLYQNAICRAAKAIPGGNEVLAVLKANGYKLGLLSNTMFTSEAHIKDLRRFDLVHFFDTMLYSADGNKWKPQPAPYLHVAEALGVDPKTAVFIGDSPEHDIVGAHRAGMRGIHFQSHQRFSLNGIEADGRISRLADLPAVLETLQG